MTRLMPSSLGGRLIALLLVALVTSQVASFVLFMAERRSSFLAFTLESLQTRALSMTQLLADTPPELHDRVLATSNSYSYRHWLTLDSVIGAGTPRGEAAELARSLAAAIGDEVGEVRAALPGPWPSQREAPVIRRRDASGPGAGGDESDAEDEARMSYATVSVQLPTGEWLNVASGRRPFTWRWAWPWIYSFGFMAAAMAVVVAIVIRRITRPLAQLADAADRLGRGEEIAALGEQGPEEVRRTTHAFNQMRERLLRFVQDRTRMLAAISHDLRTPITTLRLRAEFLDDEEARDRILATLDEMQEMAEATLAFAQEESAREDTRTVDLGALVSSLCDDLADLGHDVRFIDEKKLVCRCRPMSCKRAVRNVIENAVRYGSRARVGLHRTAGNAVITVDDDGPGIPPGRIEEVFAPFVRLEESRSKDTGGVGLGLAIARSIIRGHGGDIELVNRPEGGLRATIWIPVEDAEA